MTDRSVVILDGTRCHLGEGPSYDPATDTVWWVDILESRLFERSLAPGTTSAKIHALPVMASDVAAIDADRHLLSADDGLYVRTIATGHLSLLCPLEAGKPGNRSNDGRVHPSGALWIGTMGRDAEPGRGSIYHVAGARITRLYGGLTTPNGMAFSPDGATGYFVDTAEGILRRVALDPGTGLPRGEPETHYDHSVGDGGIDGAAVDADGLIWTARFGASCLDAYSPSGERVHTIPVPVRQPTCPTFAGRALDRLLVTTGYEGMDEVARAADPEHGRTLLVDIGVRGLLEPAFRLDA
ncbi:Sugar lactone lactonase YvrE [Methylobacterium sp. UNC300MFChir4.1]|uniref:SMP-30/gluconolactonase/LRE family protein n=1 Tax=unclassified Methylobacterium TaxID=2615210 RepID=UPI0008A7B8D3|nr:MULTISPECIES: SMP-30/gluconolactonase/LRE family protein [unclassified Methylobacterium]SEI14700.1 Sugar lactone lactonase YvrE [Methylobacterium sp. 275MFSha3.1]SEP39394.1 Sugar lactone lactonase YvrE [Methylobacterium sp. UNC300MFChir4.1]